MKENRLFYTMELFVWLKAGMMLGVWMMRMLQGNISHPHHTALMISTGMWVIMGSAAGCLPFHGNGANAWVNGCLTGLVLEALGAWGLALWPEAQERLRFPEVILWLVWWLLFMGGMFRALAAAWRFFTRGGAK